jgi:hypothetical protein
MTDNAFSYRYGRALAAAIAEIGARHKFIKPHCPWQNGKVERLNRTLQVEWAYRARAGVMGFRGGRLGDLGRSGPRLVTGCATLDAGTSVEAGGLSVAVQHARRVAVRAARRGSPRSSNVPRLPGMDVEVLSPVSPPSVEVLPLAMRPGSLDGLRVGVLSNMKSNATELLDFVSDELRERVATIEVVRELKPQGPTVAAADDVMGRLQKCEAVILAIAD